MKQILRSTQKTIEALQKINKYGKSEISKDIYLTCICSDLASGNRYAHVLAVAELMAMLAPDHVEDEWYVAGLLHEAFTHRINGSDISPRLVKSVMERAGINQGIIYSIENYNRTNNPSRWNQLMATLAFCDSHVDSNGNYLTTKECCASNINREKCSGCIYARYFFSLHGMDRKAEDTISLLKEKQKFEENEAEGKEKQHGENDTGGTEKRVPKAAAVLAG